MRGKTQPFLLPLLLFLLAALSQAFPATTTALAPAATLLAAVGGLAGGTAGAPADAFAADPGTPETRAGSSAGCGAETTPAAALTCLLGPLTFTIPPIHVPNIKDNIALDINGLACKNFALADLEIDFSGDHADADAVKTEHVKATLTGATVACAGDIKLSHVPVLGSLSAHAKVGLSKLQLSLEADFRNDGASIDSIAPHPELPTAASLTVPSSNPTPDLSLSLSLSGSFVADIVNLIGKSLLESTIRKAILSALQTDVPQDLSPLLSQAVANVSRLVRPFLDPPPSAAVPTDASRFPPGVRLPDVIRWDRGLAGEIFPAVSEILSDLSEDDSPLLNHVLDFLGFFMPSWPTGSVVLPLNDTTIHIGDDGLTETNLTLSNVTLHGLDTLAAEGLRLLRPKASGESPSVDYQLATSLSIPRLVVTLDAVVSLAPSSIVGKGEGALVAPASIVVDLSDLGVDLDLLLAFDFDPFSRLQLGQMLEPACVAASLAAVNVSKLDFRSHLTPKHPPQLTFLSPGISLLANELVAVIDGLYADVLSEAIRGVLAVPVRDALNGALRALVLEARQGGGKPGARACKAMPAPTGKLGSGSGSEHGWGGEGEDGRGEDESVRSIGQAVAETADRTGAAGLDTPLDFVNNPLFVLIFAVVDVLFAVDGSSPVQYSANDAIRTLTNGTGVLALGKADDGTGAPVVSLTNLSIMNLHVNASVDAVRVQGLDDIKVLSLSAADASTLSLDLGVGPDFAVEVDVSFALVVDALDAYGDILTDGTPPLTDAVESMKIRLALPQGRVTTKDLRALVDATSLAALDVRHLMSSPSCIASTFASAHLGGLTLRSDNATLDVKCEMAGKGRNGSVSGGGGGGARTASAGVEENSDNNVAICTEGFAELSALLEEPAPQAQLVRMIGRLVLDAVDIKMGQPAIHLLNDLAGNYTKDASAACAEANRPRSGSGSSGDGSSSNTSSSGSEGGGDDEYTGIYPELSFWLGVISFALFGLGIFVGGYMQCQERVKKSRSEKISRDRGDGDSNKSPLLDPTSGVASDAASTASDKEIDASNLALVHHPGVPAFARWSVPLFLVSGMFMYASGNTTVGASVNVNLQLADLNVTIPPVFDFSLGNSIRDMWSAQVYPLALLILVFSGIWPYAKLVMMLCCWFIPPGRCLPVKRRGMWLEALDALGKWSLIDTFVLVMMMVAFRFHIENQKTWDYITFLPDDFLVVDVIVGPGWGIFAFIIATVISLVSTHVVIAFHRAAVESVLDAEDTKSRAVRRFSLVDPTLQRRRSLMNHAFSYRNRTTGATHAVCTTFGRVIICLLIMLTFGLAVWGSLIDSFSFEFQGLAGTLLGQPPTYYSLVSLANSILPPGGITGAGPGTITLWITFLLFAFVFPLIYLVLILALWTVPLTLYEQRKLHVTVEVIHAWGAMEVFVLSIVAALLELKQFAGFIVGSKCDMINRLVTAYLSEALPAEDDVCFTVITQLTHGTFVLVSASLLIMVVGQYVMRTSHHAVEDRFRRDSGRFDEDQVTDWGLPANRCTDVSQLLLGKFCLMTFEKRFEFDRRAINAAATPSRGGELVEEEEADRV